MFPTEKQLDSINKEFKGKNAINCTEDLMNRLRSLGVSEDEMRSMYCYSRNKKYVSVVIGHKF